MFLQLAHTRLKIYTFSEELTLECYKLTKLFPSDEKFGLVQQIRRAATSVYLNIAEGSSRGSHAERVRFFVIARGSIVEIDAALNLASKLSYVNDDNLKQVGFLIINIFKMLSAMINQNSNK